MHTDHAHRIGFSIKGQHLGAYVADLVVEQQLIVELKRVSHFANGHLGTMHQLFESLKASTGTANQA